MIDDGDTCQSGGNPGSDAEQPQGLNSGAGIDPTGNICIKYIQEQDSLLYLLVHLRVDDIMTIYHPHSGLQPTIEHFEDYGRDEDAIRTILVDSDLTSKFGSLAEFEFAELVLQASLNRKTIDRLLTIVLAIRDGAEFSFRKHTDIEAAWDTASCWHAPVRYCTHLYCIRCSCMDIGSSKSILLLRRTRMKSSSLPYGLETYGGGPWISSRIQIWLNILNGMLAV